VAQSNEPKLGPSRSSAMISDRPSSALPSVRKTNIADRGVCTATTPLP